MKEEQDMNGRKNRIELENPNYLSDQELEQLILQVEQNELVAAPPDLVQEILSSLDVSTYGLEHLPEAMPKQLSEQQDTMTKHLSEQSDRKSKYLSEQQQDTMLKQLSEQQAKCMPEKSGTSVTAVRKERTRTRGQRRAEFCRYCLQVTAAAAAAILVVFTLPDFLNTRRVEISTKQEYETAPDYPTKEDVMTEQSLLGKAFGGKNIFSKQTNWLFKNETGG